jgi:hypothetical protein
MLTFAFPFQVAKTGQVEASLDELGNPATRPIRDKLRDLGFHFISMSVVPGDNVHGPILVLCQR